VIRFRVGNRLHPSNPLLVAYFLSFGLFFLTKTLARTASAAENAWNVQAWL
jgi:hypothetical protein